MPSIWPSHKRLSLVLFTSPPLTMETQHFARPSVMTISELNTQLRMHQWVDPMVILGIYVFVVHEDPLVDIGTNSELVSVGTLLQYGIWCDERCTRLQRWYIPHLVVIFKIFLKFAVKVLLQCNNDCLMTVTNLHSILSSLGKFRIREWALNCMLSYMPPFWC